MKRFKSGSRSSIEYDVEKDKVVITTPYPQRRSEFDRKEFVEIAKSIELDALSHNKPAAERGHHE
jgi:hypothetical protein